MQSCPRATVEARERRGAAPASSTASRYSSGVSSEVQPRVGHSLPPPPPRLVRAARALRGSLVKVYLGYALRPFLHPSHEVFLHWGCTLATALEPAVPPPESATLGVMTARVARARGAVLAFRGAIPA